MVISLKSDHLLRPDKTAIPTLKTKSSAQAQALSVSAVRGSLTLIDECTPEWRSLALRAQSQPFVLPEWIRAYLSVFEPTAQLEIIKVNRQQSLIGLMVLIRERSSMYGIPVRRLRAPVDRRIPDRFDIVCADEDNSVVAQAIWSHLSERTDWDVLELVDLPENGPGWRMMKHAGQCGYRAGNRQSRRTPYISIGAPGTDLASLAPATSAKFRANLRRRRTRLGETGPIKVTCSTTADDATIDRFLALENAGWKGVGKTSILSRERMSTYYRTIATSAAANGYLAMYSLEAGGETIAMHLGLTLFGRYFVPKLTFDETRHEFGPGHLLISEVLADCAVKGVKEFDFLGDEADWKRAWTDDFLVHHRVHIFRPTIAGRLVHYTRFRIVPVIRQIAIQVGFPIPRPEPTRQLRGSR